MDRQHCRINLSAAVGQFEKQTALADTPVSEDSERWHPLRKDTLTKGRFERFDFLSPTNEVRRIGRKTRSEEHTSELQSRGHLVCRLLLEKKKNNISAKTIS